MTKVCIRLLVALLAISPCLMVRADADVPSRFLNRDSVVNSRHNMTHRQASEGVSAGIAMSPYRNEYGEVCVYCHTPHSSNTTTMAPLWNRTMREAFYTNYNSTTLDGIIVAPGVNSLTCLSCHDGTTAVDSVINMPGSGGYNKSQEMMQNDEFLDTWNNVTGADAIVHQSLSLNLQNSCLFCHSPGGGQAGSGAADFTASVVGTDLSNDHPVGVPYRDPAVYLGADYRSAERTSKNLRFFDTDGDGRADSDEIRFYDSGNGYRVECASCHDPHGVPSNGEGTLFNKTFMRVTNAGSRLCLTCHSK